MATTNTIDTTAQDDETQAMLAAAGNHEDQLMTPDVFNRPSVTVSIPDQLRTRLTGVSDHIRTSLEETLLDQAVQNWSALQATIVQSFGELNTVGPQRFPLENFLQDALEIIGMALRSHSMANVASADVSSAQVSLGLNPRATENLSTPRMMMKLLQIIEKINSVTLEEANQRKLYVARIESIKRDRIQSEEKLRTTPADTVENRAIRAALELDISRMGPQIAATEDQIAKLDKRVADIAVAAGKILNVHYQPENLSATVDGFIQAVRDVPTVASKVSPKELSKLSGNPSLSFTVELPKVEKAEVVSLEAPTIRPPAAAKKAPVRSTPRRTPTRSPAFTSPFTFAADQVEALPEGARLLGTIKLPSSGMRVRVYSGSANALEQVVAGLSSGVHVVTYIPPAAQNSPESDEQKMAAANVATEYARDNIELFATRYEQYTGTDLPLESRGHVKIFSSGGSVLHLNDFPVGLFDEKGAPLPEKDLVDYLRLLYRS
ncbi:MAG: hypothetical protein NTX63_04015 [Candidatus Peregrinibacteria bacterium]|nr:hypothetical protein [Candidatus Peregrinibacteria bacterium]